MMARTFARRMSGRVALCALALGLWAGPATHASAQRGHFGFGMGGFPFHHSSGFSFGASFLPHHHSSFFFGLNLGYGYPGYYPAYYVYDPYPYPPPYTTVVYEVPAYGSGSSRWSSDDNDYYRPYQE